MSLLTEIMGQAKGAQPAAPQAQQQQSNLLEGVAAMLFSQQVGGIGGLAKMFQNCGLGQIVAGWIGRGPNPPVSTDQLNKVLGDQRIADFAKKLGVTPDQAATHLAAVLPHAVDQLTPDGAIPATDTELNAQSVFNVLKSKFLS